MDREIETKTAYLLLVICLILIAGCVLLNLSLVYGFAASIVLALAFFRSQGFSVRELAGMMARGLGECRTLYVLILLIGATVSIWLASGVVPAMIYYGFEYMKGMNFLFAAFLIVALSSVFMGTAVGTVSTIGLAILGIGKGFGIPTAVLLGAIVSGAFIADKISPISGLLNLTLSSTNTSYKNAFRSMLVTLLPTLLLTAGIYYYIGLKFRIGSNLAEVVKFQAAIREGFFISPFLLLVPALIVIISFCGVKIVYSILTGLLGGTAISLFLQKMTLAEVLRAVLLGYRADTASVRLNEILKSGGMVSMLEVVLIVMGAIALSSIFEGTGLITLIIDKVVAKTGNKGEMVLKTGLISSILTIVTCDQTLGIVLPGRLLRDRYDRLGMKREVLARTISDTGTIIAPLMPWNVNSLIIGLIAGMKAAYAPFAVLCYISPLTTVIYGLMVRRKAVQ